MVAFICNDSLAAILAHYLKIDMKLGESINSFRGRENVLDRFPVCVYFTITLSKKLPK